MRARSDQAQLLTHPLGGRREEGGGVMDDRRSSQARGSKHVSSGPGVVHATGHLAPTPAIATAGSTPSSLFPPLSCEQPPPPPPLPVSTGLTPTSQPAWHDWRPPPSHSQAPLEPHRVPGGRGSPSPSPLPQLRVAFAGCRRT